MDEETSTTPPTDKPEVKDPANGILGTLLGAVKLDWIRPLIFRVGGRKVAIGALGLYVIRDIVIMDLSDLVKVGACAGCAVTAVGIAWAIGHEDGKKQEAK